MSAARARLRRPALLLPGLPRRPRHQRQAMQPMRLPSPRPPPRAAVADAGPYRLRRVLRHGGESATIRSSPTSRSSSAAASAAWCRRPATSPRTFGVRSAMPMFKALALCPQAVVIRPDMAKYVRVGREVRHAMQALTPLVEPLSIDEAFLDLSGTQRVHGMIPGKSAGALCPRGRARHRHHGFGRPVLQQVSGQDRLRPRTSPRGFAALDQDEAREMLADKPVGFIFGVGPATQEKLVAARLSHHRRSAARRRGRI